MNTHSTLPRRISCLLILAMFSVIASPALADNDATYAQLLESRSPSLVTIKFVLTLTAPQGEVEQEQEATGVLIDPQGMILASNIKMGDIERVLMIRSQGRATGISTKVKDIKVLIGKDTEGVEAEFVARDSELDLAWLRLKDPKDAPYPHVDLEKKAEPQLGDRVLSLRRLGRYFNHVPVVGEGRVAGVINKPRRLYKLSGDAGEGIGLPVYTADGKIIGFSVVQLPDLDDIGGDFSASIGGMEELKTMAEGLILPVDDVIKATQRAKVNPNAAAGKSEGARGDQEKAGTGKASDTAPAVDELEEVNWDEELKNGGTEENEAPKENATDGE